MEAAILIPFKPEWAWEGARARGTLYAMKSDALVTARKVRQEIASKDDIENAFDNITYEKGAAVISMFEAWVGADRFQKAVHRYLTDHAYASATSADFFAAVSAEAGRDVGPAFSSFLDQPGVPLVGAEIACNKKDGAAQLTLTQERYQPVGSRGAAPEAWQIPICVRYGDGKDTGRACTLLAGSKATLALPALPSKRCPAWVVPNERGAGYYHVALSPAAIGALFGAGKALSLDERLGLASDLDAVAHSGRLPAGDALARLPDLVSDPSTDVQRAAAELLRGFPDRLIDPALRPKLAAFVTKALGKRARELGFRTRPGETDAVRVLRPMMLDAVLDRGEDAALGAEAIRLAHAWLDDPKSLEDDMVDTALDNAARRGDRALYDRIRAELPKSAEGRRRQHLFRALGSFRDPALVRESLTLYMSPDLDPREAIDLLFQDERSAGVAFAFVKENYDRLLPRLPVEMRVELPHFADDLCSEADRADAEAFFGPRVADLMGGPRTLSQALERVTLCAAMKEGQKGSFAAFLKKK
jgi:cytosol alanyl aminopeptidase